MDDTDDDHPSQSSRIFDTSPYRFREGRPEDQFSGASGVLFEQAMAQTRMAICLCDPHQPDVPIVFANRAFRALTGYDEEEIIGRNCRFLQGPDTDPEPVARIRHALEKEEVAVVELLNYRKDGTPFWNALHLGPVYDDAGTLVYFFGSQWDVSDVRVARSEQRHAKDMARELSHRMKNMFAVISGIVSITGRMRGIDDEAREINARIQALGRAYETTLDEASQGSIEVGPAIRSILAPYATGEDHLLLKGNGSKMPFQAVSTIGIVLHELAANATRHGAWSREDGLVEVDWSDRDGELAVVWTERGGPAVDRNMIEPGAGTAIMDRVVAAGGGRIERNWKPDGLEATLKLELPD